MKKQKIYFNGKEVSQKFIDDYIKSNGKELCNLGIEYNNAFIKYTTKEYLK